MLIALVDESLVPIAFVNPLRAGNELRFGGIVINGPSRWRLDHMPYGGVKRSGIGREGPRFAIEDMSELRMLVLG